MRVLCDLELIWPHLLYGTMIGLEYDIHSLKLKPPPFSFLLIISFFVFFMYSCSLAHERICQLLPLLNQIQHPLRPCDLLC